MSATDPTPSPLSDDALRKWRETAENQPIRTSYVTYYDAPKRIVALVDDLLSTRASLAAAEGEIARLREALEGINVWIDDSVDVEDGAEGPRPNLAMRVRMIVEAALSPAPKEPRA